ncbi:hypothetical protein B566_EDAN016543 [Ephemera danica]|nr:hypothetical protein B566_EDAN016543 [Ephemera danica]
MFEKIKQKFSERLLDGSGCKLSSIEKLQVRTSKNNPLRASSYLQLPDFISRRLAIINPYNVDDHECFKWSVCASIYKGPHPERTGKLLPYVQRFDWTDVKFPSSIEDVRKFECNNPTVSINIYALSTNDKLPEVFPIKVAEREKNHHIDLLVLENGKNRHYTYFKNFDRLLSSQLTNYNGVTLICKRCLSHHYSEEALPIHKKHCSKFPIARIELPQTKVGEDGQPIKPVIAFKNVEHSEKLPIVIYADFESYLPKVQGCVNNPENSSTTVVQEHIPISYGFYVVFTLPPEETKDIPLKYQTFEGENAAKYFLEALEDISKKVSKIYRRKEPMNLTRDEWRDFHRATTCYLCQKPFTEENYKVRDHCHITGKYRSTAQNVRKFECNNPTVSINIYALSTNDKLPEVFPIKVAEREKNHHIDLLVLENGKNRHYTYFKNFDRLLSSQLTNYNGVTLICKRCLSHHYSEKALTIHKKHCSKFPIARIELPQTKVGEDGQPIKPVIAFKNVEHSEKFPIVIYADFKSYLPKVQGCVNNPENSSTTVVQEHIPISYGFYVVSTLPPEETKDIPLKYQTFEGENAAKYFLEALEDISKKVSKIYRRKEPMNLTRDEWRDFHRATTCYLCQKPFTEENYKVRDHCHITGKYRSTAQSSCNLRDHNPHYIPVFAHKMSGYDSKFIIRELEHTPGPIHVVPNTEEEFIAFSKKPEDGVHLLFLDSLRFMSSSLDSLVKNLPKEKMTHLKKMFPNDLERELMSRKGVFCYDYLDDLKKLKETCLPPKEAFKSSLTDEDISDEDYQHAQNVWKTLKCKTLRDYLALYLKADVALLSDVFEEFRAVCLKTYELNPCWYYTAPSLTWDAALKYTGVKLDLIQDLEIIEMVERGIRGGVAQCTKSYAEAKNKYTEKKPDPGCEPNYIAYLDANNL